jgi:hypothetical protein
VNNLKKYRSYMAFTVNIEDKNELNPADELKLTLKD